MEEQVRPALATIEEWEALDNIMVVEYESLDFNEQLTDEQWQVIKDTYEMRGVDIPFRMWWLPKNGYDTRRGNLFDTTLHANGVVIE